MMLIEYFGLLWEPFYLSTLDMIRPNPITEIIANDRPIIDAFFPLGSVAKADSPKIDASRENSNVSPMTISIPPKSPPDMGKPMSARHDNIPKLRLRNEKALDSFGVLLFLLCILRSNILRNKLRLFGDFFRTDV